MEKAYETFINILDVRSTLKRQIYKISLSELSNLLCQVIAVAESPFLFCLLDEKIEFILNDCKPYNGESKEKILDSLLELSNLCSLYYTNKDKGTYNHICNLMDENKQRLHL